jgi:hypothetical protein
MRNAFVAALLFAPHSAALASDQDSNDLAKAAMAANDCPLAARTLDGLTPQAKQDPGVLFLMARANECAGNLDQALEYYRRYDAVVPNIPEVRDAIGKLLLKIEERRRAFDEQERQRIEQERNDAAAAEWQRQEDIRNQKAWDLQRRQQEWRDERDSRRNIAVLLVDVPVTVGFIGVAGGFWASYFGAFGSGGDPLHGFIGLFALLPGIIEGATMLGAGGPGMVAGFCCSPLVPDAVLFLPPYPKEEGE